MLTAWLHVRAATPWKARQASGRPESSKHQDAQIIIGAHADPVTRSIRPLGGPVTKQAIPTIAPAPRPSMLLLLTVGMAVSTAQLRVDPHAAHRLAAGTVTLGLPLARGAFGSVHWARGASGERLVAKRAAQKKPHAADYLSVEANLNAKLRDSVAGSCHLAPFLGLCNIGYVDHIVWAACPGVHHTLDWYLRPNDRAHELAVALGVDAGSDRVNWTDLSQRLLHEMLSGLALLHSHGLVHRDIKPENFLVDARTHSLRLIDLGSACLTDSGGQTSRLPTTTVWAPPELALTKTSPWAFDVYSAALVWLRSVVPSFASHQEFDLLRADLRLQPSRAVHDCLERSDIQLAGCVTDLVSQMLNVDPRERVSATEALCRVGCSEPPPATQHHQPCEDDHSCRLPLDEECSV